MQELEKELIKSRRDKEDEVEKREKEKVHYEKLIKELQDEIKMLMSNSGDQVKNLELKIKQLVE